MLLGQEERTLIERKYSAPNFKMMSAADLNTSALGLLFKISVITGWRLPEDAHAAEVLEQQFSLKMIESYPMCNSNEVEYAFRNNTSVKDWGKDMNLSLIDEVMKPYLSERMQASNAEMYVQKPKELLGVEMSNEEIIQDAKDIYYATGNFQYISYKVYDRLYNMGLLRVNPIDKEEIRKSVNALVEKAFFEDKDLFFHTKREDYEMQRCKQMAVAKYFDKIKIC